MRSCTSTTKKGTPCSIYVEEWRTSGKCHVHDPNGKFRQQVKKGEHRIPQNKEKGCDHTWYMRDPGIQCTKCFLIWENDIS
jgi:hypothetical protein